MPVHDNLKETAPIHGGIDLTCLGISGCFYSRFDWPSLLYIFPCGLTIANKIAFLMMEDFKNKKLAYKIIHQLHHQHRKDESVWTFDITDIDENQRRIGCSCKKIKENKNASN